LPVTQRIQEVTDFLNDIDSTLQYEVVPIQDPFGPTATDPNMDLIVVSTETLRGGQKVNELRTKNNLNQLEIYSIDLVEFKPMSEVLETKVSSSNKRMDMLGTRLRLPDARPNLPNDPYIIGLMGGIASGKSSMAERFEKLGANIIDCDKLAHQLYEPGEDCFNAIQNYFGSQIIGSDGRIDRKVLGSIVFADKVKVFSS
jgi:phosphopantetheine adenylyltransferase / dephospho-CoA kinase